MKLNSIFDLSLLIGAYITMCSCVNSDRCLITFENNSNIHVDSTVFLINNLASKLGSTQPHQTISKFIHKDSIKANKHDVTVIGSIYVDGKLFRGGFSYNDLSGSINDQYTLTLHEDNTTTLK